jgi:hypothetical protein
MGIGPDPLKLLDHEAPARRGLERGAQPLALEARQDRRTAGRSAGAILPRSTSPVSVFKASKVICPR